MRIYTKVTLPWLYRNKEYYAARKWCANTIGASNSRSAKNAARPWYAKRQWAHGCQESLFYFRNPAHATMFQLVWAKEFRQT